MGAGAQSFPTLTSVSFSEVINQNPGCRKMSIFRDCLGEHYSVELCSSERGGLWASSTNITWGFDRNSEFPDLTPDLPANVCVH